MLIFLIASFFSVNLCFRTAVPQTPSTSFIETASITLFDSIPLSSNMQNYSISFNQNFSAIPKLAVTLQDIESPSKFHGFCFQTNTQFVHQAGFQVTVSTCNSVVLSKLKIQYLAFDPSLKFNLFIREYQIYNITTKVGQVNLQLMPNCSQLFGDNYVQNDQRLISWASLRSLTILPVSTPYYSLNVKTLLNCIYPEQYFRLNVRELFIFDSPAIVNQQMPIFPLNLLTHVKVIVIATKGFKYYEEIKITTSYQQLDYLTNQQSFTIQKSPATHYLVGIYNFRTSSSCTFGFGWQLVNQTDSSFTLSAIVNYIGLTVPQLIVGVKFSYQIFNIFYCSYPYIYFNQTSKLCQDDCEAGSYLSFDTYTCIKCQSQVCIQCNQDKNGCVKCNESLGYVLSNNTCVCPNGFISNGMNQLYECKDICGDGKMFTNQCDDGNTVDGDGCSSNCTIQNGSFCVNGTPTSPSICTVLATPPLTVVSFVKQEDANAFNIQLAPENQLGRLLTETNNETIFIQNGIVFYLNFPYESVTYNSAPAHHLSLRVTYSESLNDKTLSMSFMTSTSGVVTITYPSVTDNNLALKVYDYQQYDTFLTFKKLMPIFSYTLWFLLVLVFFFVSKLIAIETLFIFQFTYGGLIMLKKLEPVMYSYKYLWVFNGFNHLYDDGVYVPPQVAAIDYNADFIANFNIDLVIFLLPLSVGALLLLINWIKNNNRVQEYGLSIIFEWQLSAMLFCIQQLVFSYILNFSYSNTKILGAFLGSILLLIYAAYAVIMFVKINEIHNRQNPLGQYRTLIKRNTKLNKHFYILVMIYRLSVSVVLVLESWSIVSDSIILIITAVWAALLIWIRPYQQNIRPIINSAVIFLLSIFLLYCRNVADSSYINFATYIPIAFICLIGLTAFTNISFAARMFYLKKFPSKSDIQFVEAISATKTEGTNTEDGVVLEVVSSYTRQNNRAVQMPIQEMLDKFTTSEPSRMKLTQTKDQNSPQKHYQTISEPPLPTVRREVSSQLQSKKDEPPSTAYKLRE